MELFFILVIH
ncbi:uncharacterized protein FTOL_13921 [Fusarium torulosum]|uniref:Uncharacterized protein n=1 Tax=Fusarium torulosum TaxID=33205 RepID=A0AAE8SQP1_9HYPO|nr:uncharacterized protein FTOL_13921 [Fusarium torulosum]